MEQEVYVFFFSKEKHHPFKELIPGILIRESQIMCTVWISNPPIPFAIVSFAIEFTVRGLSWRI